VGLSIPDHRIVGLEAYIRSVRKARADSNVKSLAETHGIYDNDMLYVAHATPHEVRSALEATGSYTNVPLPEIENVPLDDKRLANMPELANAIRRLQRSTRFTLNYAPGIVQVMLSDDIPEADCLVPEDVWETVRPFYRTKITMHPYQGIPSGLTQESPEATLALTDVLLDICSFVLQKEVPAYHPLRNLRRPSMPMVFYKPPAAITEHYDNAFRRAG
jgi:hypothetical protein